MNFIEEQQREAREKNKCWHPYCDNDQTITDAFQNEEGYWEPQLVQCQYCWTREQIVAQTITNTLQHILENVVKPLYNKTGDNLTTNKTPRGV